jgi:hypothetical protein
VFKRLALDAVTLQDLIEWPVRVRAPVQRNAGSPPPLPTLVAPHPADAAISVRCVAEPAPSWGDGPHAWRAGDFRLCRDIQLMEKVKPVAEMVHFGPHRGVDWPKAPPP